MKLRTKIAGTLALPLALAVASAANAATVVDNDDHTLKIGGFVAATADWTIQDDAGATQDSDVDFGMGLGVSRLNIAYTQKTSVGDITYLYENDFRGKNDAWRLRHAAIMHDGYVAGFTWSGFSNLTGLPETVDYAGPGKAAATARVPVLGKNITVADGMSVGVFLEDYSNSAATGGSGRKANTAVPDLVANFKGKFGTTDVFAAARMVQKDKLDASGNKLVKQEAEGEVDLTFGVNSQVTDQLGLKVAVTSYDGDDLAASLGGQFKINDQIRTNLVFQQVMGDADDTDSTAIWVNAFYKMEAGWEWGAEVISVSTDTNGNEVTSLGDKDMRVSLMAKYAF